MRIDVKGRNLPVSDELRDHVAKRFRKVERQVSELASLEVELFEERNPAIAEPEIAEATLVLKGVTLRARSASPDIVHSINVVSDELCRQVKRHRDKRRNRREARGAAAAAVNEPAPVLDGEVVLEGDVVLKAQVEPLPPDVSSAA
jgi:ribosome hibernation promoting factor